MNFENHKNDIAFVVVNLENGEFRIGNQSAISLELPCFFFLR